MQPGQVKKVREVYQSVREGVVRYLRLCRLLLSSLVAKVGSRARGYEIRLDAYRSTT